MSKAKIGTTTVWIREGDLAVVWPDAQRPLNESHVNIIADNFDPEMVGVLHVTAMLPNGKHHLIEGQHRAAAIKKLFGEDERVPCIVHQDCTTAEQAAKIWDFINTKRWNPTPLERFVVRITEGEETETAIDKIVRKAGYRVCAGKHENGIQAVQALLFVYARYGGEALANALAMIKATWGGDANAVEAAILRGYGALLCEHEDLDRERLKVRIQKKYTPAQLIGAAKAAREVEAGSIADGVKVVLRSYYNKGLPDRSKLKPQSDNEEVEAVPRPRYSTGFSGYDRQSALNAKSR